MTDAQSAQIALDKLIESVEAGWAPDVLEHSDAMSAKHIRHVMDAYHGSLSATLALHEALLPGWEPKIGLTNAVVFLRTHKGNDPTYSGMSSVMARAWLLAILRAYRSTQQ